MAGLRLPDRLRSGRAGHHRVVRITFHPLAEVVPLSLPALIYFCDGTRAFLMRVLGGPPLSHFLKTKNLPPIKAGGSVKLPKYPKTQLSVTPLR